jgi:hypothetical protein
MEQTRSILERLSDSEVVASVGLWLSRNKQGTRHGLAAHLCQELDLYDGTGKPRLAGTQKALRTLEARGFWVLPEPQTPNGRKWTPRCLDGPVQSPEAVPAGVEDVCGLHLALVTSRDDNGFRIWNELVEREHPLDCRLVGRQLRYLIGSDHGWLGAFGFGSCALRSGARDDWLGWDDAARAIYQERLVALTRFLIRPQVRCENLASRALGLCMKRLPCDYAERYGIEPWLVETFVDRAQFAGTCFQAANWVCIGTTKGRGRNAPTSRPVTSRKDIYLYPLKKDWRKAMGLASPAEKMKSVALEEALDSQHWVELEFGGVDLGHRNRERRLFEIVSAKAQSPASPYTKCLGGNRHQLKAFYRFMGTDEVTPQAILSGHRQRTIGRMKGRKRVLIVQDSTDLDFSDRLHCNGLGVIGTNQTGAESPGLKMHSALALKEDGMPLGVLGIDLYPPKTSGSKPQNRPIEEKESYRWLRTFEDAVEISGSLDKTELVCVGDRESDIYELFDLRRRHPHVHVLVRGRYNRCLKNHERKLFDHLDDLPAMAHAEVPIPRQREKKGKPSRPGRPALAARTAQVELKWDRVTVAPPKTPQTRALPPVEINALLVVEKASPEGAKPVRWRLLTSLPLSSRKQALRCLRHYASRWRIEEWHRILKNDCGIQAHQHHTAERLGKAAAIDAVIAWRAMLITLLGREAPDLPAKFFFSPLECRLLKRLQPIFAPETIEGEKGGN